MVWNLEELKSLCIAKNVTYPQDFVETLGRKMDIVKYHIQQAEDAWTKLFQNNLEVRGGSPEWNVAALAAGAESEAAVHVLYTMLDILAQVINAIVLNGALPEKDVNLWSVKSKLPAISSTTPIISKIQQLVDSQAFKYVRAASNTIKHRRLLDLTYRAEYGTGRRNQDGIVFKSFSYDGDLFPEVWIGDILDSYVKPVFDALLEIGNSINDFLR